MIDEEHRKVKAAHLKRNAYLYIRQSTVQQVFGNAESTERQYALRKRAIALGWPEERVVVIDSDLGQSGASATDREGFQKLVTEAGMGRAGIVLGLEVSRLARNSSDWHRLLEICALTDTLILDEDGIYDPAHFNDRLLLGLKGTMSEAELHVLRARLHGGKLNKARRGELQMPLPVGLLYDGAGRVTLDPDKQIQETIRLFFGTFRRTGTASATEKYFRQQGLKFPTRLSWGPNKGDVVWNKLKIDRAIDALHNPRYAGAYVFGRRKSRKSALGSTIMENLPKDQWHTIILDAHPGYISWQEFEDNQRRIRENGQAYGIYDHKTPPREGPALLQGLAVCGICGYRMTVRYDHQSGHASPYYYCNNKGNERGTARCQYITGASVDNAIGQLLIESVTPMALEVSLTVQEKLQSRIDEADQLRRRHVERARYEVDIVRRRYMKVDPDNRLVADELEEDWNSKLRDLAEAEEEYERQRNADRMLIDEEQRTRILALATDFPRLWRDPRTSHRERKRMVRLMIEDVTLT